MSGDITGIAVSDEETRATIRSVDDQFGYLMEPHTAVAYCALERYRAIADIAEKAAVVLSTAHPVKFLEAIEETLNKKIQIPLNLQELMKKKKSATLISSEYKELASFLNELDK